MSLVTAWRRFRHRLYRDRPGWRRSPWAGGGRYWYEPDDGWPEGPLHMGDWSIERTSGLLWCWRIARYNPTPSVMAEHVGPFLSERAARRAAERIDGDGSPGGRRGGETATDRRWPKVSGRCPACGSSSLFVAEGDYITCGYLPCPHPTYIADLLEILDVDGA